MRRALLTLIGLLVTVPAGAQVTHVGAANGSANPTTSFTVTIPAGTQTDDLLWLTVTNKDGAGVSPSVADDDSGGNAWARIANDANYKASLWWKRATASTASKTITVTGLIDSSSGVLTVDRGGDTGATPYEGLTIEESDTPHAGFTTTRNGTMIHLATIHATNDITVADQTTATSPGALTERGEHLSTGGTDSSNTQASEQQATAGATGNFSWTAVATSFSIVWATLPIQTADTRRSRMSTQGVGR